MVSVFKKTIYLITIFLILAKLGLTLGIFLYPGILPVEELDISAKEIIDLTNNYRIKENLKILTMNPRLTQAAVNKANNMFAEQYFNHTSPEGKIFSDWIKDVDYHYFTVGENLAIDFHNASEVFDAWLKSPSHKSNIVRPQYQEIGVAALSGIYDDRLTTIVVQIFGTRLFAEDNPPLPAPINDAAKQIIQTTWWQKYTALENLVRTNTWSTYLLIIFVGLTIITYAPPTKTNQINIKQPIINRYQAKIFKE